MTEDFLISVMDRIRSGELSPTAGARIIAEKGEASLGYAVVDTHRRVRTGFDEVIYSPGKKPEQIAAIIGEMKKRKANAIATRAEKSLYEYIHGIFPEAVYFDDARIISVQSFAPVMSRRHALILSAGCADIPVAEEAFAALQCMGISAEKIYDAGVAGIHRLLSRTEDIRRASVIIAVAGMEGALASVVGGLFPAPVIAVPTSVGYGANFGGVSALLTMLTSCASGVTVVNIDNGFGAAAAAARMIAQMEKEL
ncbi:MAG: nickel pincer cofactor biosynthesis protein LarB [Spirochaetota bacterium]